MRNRCIVIFIIFFTGICCLVSVDRECHALTGKGGDIGVSVGRSETGRIAVNFFGLEGEIGL